MAKSTRKHPTLADCMTMMRSRDPQVQEDGFHLLHDRAHLHVNALIEAFAAATDPGLKRWLMELLTFARDPELASLFVAHLDHADEGLRRWAEVGLRLLDTRKRGPHCSPSDSGDRAAAGDGAEAAHLAAFDLLGHYRTCQAFSRSEARGEHRVKS